MSSGPGNAATSSPLLSKHAQGDFALSASPIAAREGGGLTLNFRDDADDGTEGRVMRDPLLSFPSESDATAREGPKDSSRLSTETRHEQVLPATPAGTEASKTESVVWEDLRAQIREAELAIKQSAAEGAALKGALYPLQGLAAQLADQYRRILDAAREAEQRSVSAVEAMQRIEKQLGPLAALQDLRQRTDERLEALKALADDVTVKEHTLTSQKETIEHAVAQSRHVADLVSAMDARMATLQDGDRLLAQIEARLGRLETLAAETTAQLERREHLRDELARELVRVETEVQSLEQAVARAGRVGDVVSAMEARMAKLRQGDPPLEQTEARLTRLEKLAAETTARLERREQLKHATPIEIGRFAEPLRRHIGWKERWGSPHLQLTRVMTALRTPNARRLITRYGAGVGLALLVPVIFLVGPFGKTAQIDAVPPPTPAPPAPTVSTPVSSGSSVTVPADEPSPPTITTTTAPSSVATRPPVATAPSARYVGTLAVQSTPAGAAVFIDRQRVGETPLQVPQVRAGSHVVWIEHEGYQRWTAAVNVPASRVTQVTVRLEAELGR